MGPRAQGRSQGCLGGSQGGSRGGSGGLNVDGDRAKNVIIAATAGKARFTCKSRKPNCHENLNFSLDVCTFAVHLEL